MELSNNMICRTHKYGSISCRIGPNYKKAVIIRVHLVQHGRLLEVKEILHYTVYEIKNFSAFA